MGKPFVIVVPEQTKGKLLLIQKNGKGIVGSYVINLKCSFYV